MTKIEVFDGSQWAGMGHNILLLSMLNDFIKIFIATVSTISIFIEIIICVMKIEN